VTDDVEYDNVPVGAVHGPDGMRSLLEPFMERCTNMEFMVHHQAAEGAVVMNERTDRFEFGDRSAEGKVAGQFVVPDGKIALCRDYFDMGDFQKIQKAMKGLSVPPASESRGPAVTSSGRRRRTAGTPRAAPCLRASSDRHRR
jgi:limonene-1,2-epoxide hydrolase